MFRLDWLLKKWIKESMVFSLYWSGAAFLSCKIFKSGKCCILCYHGVGEPAAGLISSNLVSEEQFRKQMDYLARRKTIVPLEKIVERLKENADIPAAWAAVTFDDGYRNCFELALPLLEKKNIPATFFVISKWIAKMFVKWDDFLSFYLKPFSKVVFRSSADDVERLLEQIETDIGPQKYRELQENNYSAALTSEQLKSLPENLFSIQSHSSSHFYLSSQTREIQQSEICESKKQLEDITGKQVSYFAFPFGGDACFNNDTFDLLNECCYHAAFNGTDRYVRQDTNRFNIPRFGINRKTPMWRFKIMISGLYFS